MQATDDSHDGLCFNPRRDRRNQWRVALWGAVWASSFIAITLAITEKWWPFEVTLAGVIGNALVGIATVLAQRRFLQETDELRRKIEVEALALAFGVGMVGGLTYWLLAVSDAVPEWGFAVVFAVMLLSYSFAVLVGLRRYS